MRRFDCVFTVNFFFQLNIIIFTAVKNRSTCLFHRGVAYDYATLRDKSYDLASEDYDQLGHDAV